MTEYLKRDIARILRKPPRTIEFWTSSGLVIPDIQPSQGRGNPRVYSEQNLVEFGMVELLSRMGVSLHRIGHIFAVLREGKWTPPDDPFEQPGHLEEWREMNTVRFDSFWTSGIWGSSRELVFAQATMISRLEIGVAEFEWWHVLKADEEGFFPFTSDEVWLTQMSSAYRGAQTIIWLGDIKNSARELASLR